MGIIGEVVFEVFVEIIGELFLESSIDLSRSKYIPKWLRIIAITIVVGFFGGLLLLVVGAVFSEKNLLIIIGIIMAVTWLFLVIKTLTLKTIKYEYVSLKDNIKFKGKRTCTGQVIGNLKPEILDGLGEDGEIKVCFLRSGEFPEKEQVAVIEEQETQILRNLYHMAEDELNAILGRARNELMMKLGDRDNGYSNGKSIMLYKIRYMKCPDEYIIYYYLRDKETGKKIKIKDEVG